MPTPTASPPSPVRPVRVALVTHVFWPSVGGAELNHLLVSEELGKSAAVLVLTARRHSNRVDAASLPAPSAISVERLASVSFFGENLIWPWRLWSRLRSFHPDVIWGNHPSLTADVGALYAILTRHPWVATYHGDLSATRFYSRLYTWWSGRLLRRASSVLVNSEVTARLLSARGVLRERILVVHPGPGIGRGDPPVVSLPPGSAPEVPGPDHPYLFVGGLDRAREYKRPDWVIRAVADLARQGVVVYVDFIGDGDRRERLARLAADAGVASLIRFRGYVRDEDLARAFASAWALILPSTRTEGFGLVAVEAAHYACPVIASSEVPAGGLLAANGGALLFAADRLDSLRDILRRVWQDAGLRCQMALAIGAVSAQFNWDRAAHALASRIIAAAPQVPTSPDGESDATMRRTVGT